MSTQLERPTEYHTPVTLTGIDIPFGQLVVALVKVGLAAIPAVILVTATILTVWLILTAVLVGAS